jgi:hypothetical protein
MNDEQLKQKIKEGMLSFAQGVGLPASALLNNVDFYFNANMETKDERLSKERLQDRQ